MTENWPFFWAKPRVPSIVDDTNQQKESACRYAVIQHLINRSLHALDSETENAEYDESEVAYGRIGD